MKRFLKTTISIILGLAILLSLGCASLPGKLNPEFAFTVMEFVARDPGDPSGQRIAEPVFSRHDIIIIYFVLANVTTVNGEVHLIAEVAVLDNTGKVMEFRETLNYKGSRIEWWQAYNPVKLVPGNYVFMITVVDVLRPSTITETLDFKIIAGTFI